MLGATRAPEFLVVRDIYLQLIVGAWEIRKTEVGGGEGRGLELIPNREVFLKSLNRTQLQCGTTEQRFDHFDIRLSQFLLSALHYTGPSCVVGFALFRIQHEHAIAGALLSLSFLLCAVCVVRHRGGGVNVNVNGACVVCCVLIAL